MIKSKNKLKNTIRFLFYLCSITLNVKDCVSENQHGDVLIFNYNPVFFSTYDINGNLVIAIRSYNIGLEHYFLTVDPNTLKTEQKHASDLFYSTKISGPKTPISMKNLSKTLYYKILEEYSMLQENYLEYGVTHSKKNFDGIFLTIDMCPSSKPLDKKFFNHLVDIGMNKKKKIPIAIALSGRWALTHAEELKWIINQTYLDITWVNHSLSHSYYYDVEIHDNFMALPRTNIREEILFVERFLLSKNIMPSVFFRFPGLLANKNLISEINTLGLIPLSTDAWLAKGQMPKLGSIILVHGNSNDQKGVEIFLQWSKENQNIDFLPLEKTVTNH